VSHYRGKILMFDVGFWELAIIAVVALLVVGPERLPGLARTTGLWVRKIRRFVSSVQQDIERDLRMEELNRVIDKPKAFDNVRDILTETKKDIDQATKTLNQDVSESNKTEAADSTSSPESASPNDAKSSQN